MSGHEYLLRIKKELQSGHWQHKKGTSVLAAFGFMRRRQSAINIINQEMKKLGLTSDPPIDISMPLDSSHIRFLLAEEEITVPTPEEVVALEEEIDEEESTESIVSSFKVAELEAAAKLVEWIKPSAPLSRAYTTMCLKKFSQLVVAETDKPLAIHVKGTVSYQSIANALINGTAKTVNECLDSQTPQVSINDEIGTVIQYLQEHDVVLVIGQDKRLSGIVTAWDLAAEFEGLVGPFKWIGEIENRIKACIEKRLGRETIHSFLTNIDLPIPENNPDILTLGDLVLIAQNPENWEQLGLPFERQTFCEELDNARELRNRLMHFRDPLSAEEKIELKRFCDLVRKIPEVGVT